MTDLSIPPTMRCIEIKAPGGPEQLVPSHRAVPVPGPGQVLIKVTAAGVNRPDVAQRLGQYPPPAGASDLPGLEVAGDIVAVGPGVPPHRMHERVCALIAGGGYAEFAVAPTGSCLSIPQGLSDDLAAAIPETVFTVWHNVFERGALKRGETLLIHGGSSGIGTTAIQLAKAFGAAVAVTAGSDEKCTACRKLGADVAVNYRTNDFVDVMRAFPGRGADVILDMVGGPYVARNIKCLRPDGRLVVIAMMGGTRAETELGAVMMKRLTITGSTLRSRDDGFKETLAASVKSHVWPLFECGQIKPILYKTFALGEASAAHALMESSSHIGKIVLKM